MTVPKVAIPPDLGLVAGSRITGPLTSGVTGGGVF
jgi:hypothetical protein